MSGTRARFLAALSIIGVLGQAEPVLAEIDITEAINAIRECRCEAEYWGDPRPQRPPSTSPIALRSEGQIATAVVDGLDGPEWVTFYAITSKGMKAVVTSSWGYNKELMKQSPGFQQSWGRVFDDNSKHAFGSDVLVGEIPVPIKCTLVLDADTAVKRAMVDAVQKSMMISLTLFNRTGANYPARVRIVIANFNTDFAGTYVLIRETGEIFGVVLEDPMEFSPADTEYVVWQPHNPSDLPPIRRKIMTTGIEREVQVGK